MLLLHAEFDCGIDPLWEFFVNSRIYCAESCTVLTCPYPRHLHTMFCTVESIPPRWNYFHNSHFTTMYDSPKLHFLRRSYERNSTIQFHIATLFYDAPTNGTELYTLGNGCTLIWCSTPSASPTSIFQKETTKSYIN